MRRCLAYLSVMSVMPLFVLVALFTLVAGASPVLAQNPKPKLTPKSNLTTAAKQSFKPLPKPSDADLMEALENENTARALNLVRRGANPNASSNGRDSALDSAVTLGDRTLVQELLARGARVNPENPEAEFPLQSALLMGHRDIARILIEKGAQVNVGDGDAFNRRPLSAAVALGDLPLVTLILDRGGEINHVTKDGSTALTTAAAAGSLPLMELLLSRGARIDKAADKNLLLLRSALAGGNDAAVDFVLARGYSLSEQTDKLLPDAVASDNPALIERVLGAGADLEAADEDGETPLFLAVQQRRAESVKFLLGKKAQVNTINRQHENVLEVAEEALTKENDTTAKTIVTLLRQAGAQPPQPTLWRAVIDGSVKPVQDLLDAGADPNLPDKFNAVPLFSVISQARVTERVPLLDVLLKKGANPNARAPDGRRLVEAAADSDEVVALLRKAGAETPERDLTEALEQGDTKAAERLLAAGVVPEPDALLLALGKKDRPLFIRLLEKGANINAPLRVQRAGLFFQSPMEFILHTAVLLEDVETVRFLLDHGANVNLRKEDGPALGSTPLLTVFGKNEDAVDAIVRLLVERGADIRAREGGSSGTSVVGHLANVAPARTLAFVLDKGAAPDIHVFPTEEAVAPLLLAVRGDRVDNVRLLLERGASPEGNRHAGEDSALMELARSEETPTNLAMAKLLIAAGARLDAKDSLGQTPLQMAEEKYSFALAEMIRKAGGKAAVAPEMAMLRAIQNGSLSAVKQLLDGGFSPGGKIPLYDRPLQAAVATGDTEIVRLLLDRGADVNEKTPMGTAMHEAAGNGDVAMLQLLMARGAKPDPDGDFLGTPLAQAAEEGHLDAMRLLLKTGADPNSRKAARPGEALRLALFKGGSEAVELLLKSGADPNVGMPWGTALLLGNLRQLERLHKAGLKINQGNELGRTILMDAATLGQKEIVAWLIAHKADVNAKDKAGRTALKEAESRNKTECAALLRKAGAKS